MATIINGHFEKRIDLDELKRLEGQRAETERLLHGLMGAQSTLVSRRNLYGKIIAIFRPGSPTTTRRSEDQIIGDLLDLLALFATLYYERSRSKR